LSIRRQVPLAPLTTLELGGPAASYAEIDSVPTAEEVIRWADDHNRPLTILGGGSNVVIADTGVSGLMTRVAIRGVDVIKRGDDVRVTAAAGEPWDELVGMTVAEDLAGLECLSGIPGLVGAAPIQNVGAYGQEVASVIDRVRVLDLTTLEERSLDPKSCRFGYRSSVFRDSPGRYLVLSVTYRLRKGGHAQVEYGELRRALAVGGATPSLAKVRDTVLDLRRQKSMVIDESDPNRRSVGSFFINPVVDGLELAALRERIGATGVASGAGEMPVFPAGENRFKVPAAWLIEQAGFERGMRRGAVGISSAHALALVHHGGGTAAELVALAREIRDGVLSEFGIELQPEPVFLGFPTENPLGS
jgi:UDP-N-acetylmuramate dehydrogenase